ncbi:MAG: UDP-3-O-(3-hydroxymyristoyl)glucosamine N-acyltransferase [Bacteroidales bacterium]|nr:UDP-3-O-(3-hydroxymyristoyl)glucosamine N-acyltransferase [Bacteroidales bacterium]
MNFKASAIAEFLKGELIGNPDVEVNNVSKIEDGQPGTLAFLGNMKYEKYVYETKASILLVNKDFNPQKEILATLIKVDNAYESFASLLELYQQGKPQKEGIRPLSSIHETATIGENVYVGEYSVIEQGAKIGNNVKIYPQVYIGDGVQIGEGCVLHPGVKVYEGSIIGKDCVFHSGTIIGSDGFGFAPSVNNDYKKVPQIGIVIIEDHVEIGANCCVDRATMGATVIRKGVKLDNLIQIAHNVELGENAVMAAQSGIAGSAKIGKNIMVGGQVAINGHIKVGDDVKIGAKSGVNSDVKDGEIIQGIPAIQYRNFWKSQLLFTKLPETRQQLNQIERDIKDLKETKN